MDGRDHDEMAEELIPSDAEIVRAEADFLEACGLPPVSRRVDVAARPEFRASLRENFIGGAASIDGPIEPSIETPIETPTGGPVEAPGSSSTGVPADAGLQKLRAWEAAAPREDFRSDLRAQFLTAVTVPTAAVGGGNSAPGPAPGPAPRLAPRLVPGPARASRLRLVGISGALAAAAAVLLFLQRPTGAVDPVGGPEVGSPGELVVSVEPAAAGSSAVEGVSGGEGVSGSGGAASGWELDATFGDPAALLASLRIDGESIGSLEELQERMASATRVESSDFELRLRHRDEFVIELAEDTGIRLDAFRPSSKSSAGEEGSMEAVIRADRGGVRVATGPGFDGRAPLVIETPHVRAQVVGTVFGLDIGDGYTCVCCMKGTVDAQPRLVAHPAVRVNALQTSVIASAKETPPGPPRALVAGHRAPLERLLDYWA